MYEKNEKSTRKQRNKQLYEDYSGLGTQAQKKAFCSTLLIKNAYYLKV